MLACNGAVLTPCRQLSTLRLLSSSIDTGSPLSTPVLCTLCASAGNIVTICTMRGCSLLLGELLCGTGGKIRPVSSCRYSLRRRETRERQEQQSRTRRYIVMAFARGGKWGRG